MTARLPGRELGDLEAIVRAAALAHPDPPRPAPLSALLRASYGSRAGASIVGVGLFVGVPLVLVGLVEMQTDRGHILTATLGGLFTAVLCGVPALPARRAARALRHGVLATARIVGARHTAPGDATTVDSLAHGRAAGTWRVSHPGGAFEASFETDAPWAGTAVAGQEVLVLVDPLERTVLFPVGPPPPGDVRALR